MRTLRELNAYAKRAPCRWSWPEFDKQEAGEQKPMKYRKTAPPSQCTSVRGLREQRVLSSSDTFAERRSAVLFFWHCQQRSVIGVMMMMDGRRVRHRRLKVEYATVWIEPSFSAAVW